MQKQYIAPEFQKTAFNCPYCGVFSAQEWSFLYYNPNARKQKAGVQGYFEAEYVPAVMQNYGNVYAEGEKVIGICQSLLSQYQELSYAKAALCSHCNKISYWLDGKMIWPAASTVEIPNPDMPEDCRQLFIEARDIAGKSPRAAAALLRLCLQKLMPHLGRKGENISEDIKALVGGNKISVQVQQALDVCRVIGNHAVHPGKIAVEENPQAVFSLFKLLNMIVEKTLTADRETKELFAGLPQRDQAAIAKRDGKLTADLTAEKQENTEKS